MSREPWRAGACAQRLTRVWNRDGLNQLSSSAVLLCVRLDWAVDDCGLKRSCLAICEPVGADDVGAHIPVHCA
jgi:hypothetical protein